MKTRWTRMAMAVPATLCAAVQARMMPSYMQQDDRKTSNAATPPEHSFGQVPVFFFHGVTDNAHSGRNYVANLTAEGRKVTALDFCENECSTAPLLYQVALAIAQIRNVIEADPEAYENGYIFIGYSQGGVLSRAVIELMDDHNVKVYISLAGVQNGVFYGPQHDDVLALREFIGGFAAQLTPRSVFDAGAYAPNDLHGKMQSDLNDVMLRYTEGQKFCSFFNLFRSPEHKRWVEANAFLPLINNVNHCDHDDVACRTAQQQRRSNFLKLKAAHFFASPQDGIVAPWQTGVFGQYQDVDSVSSIAEEFDQLEIIDMKKTKEYKEDTFGLKTLDERGGLFLHVLPGLHHSCWVEDVPGSEDVQPCAFQRIYEKHIYPILLH